MKKIIISFVLLCFVYVSLCETVEDKAKVINAATVQLFFPPNNTISPLCNQIPCTMVYLPVCGFSVCLGFKTFSNACELGSYNACHAIKYTEVADESCETAFTRCYVKPQ